MGGTGNPCFWGVKVSTVVRVRYRLVLDEFLVLTGSCWGPWWGREGVRPPPSHHSGPRRTTRVRDYRVGGPARVRGRGGLPRPFGVHPPVVGPRDLDGSLLGGRLHYVTSGAGGVEFWDLERSGSRERGSLTVPGGKGESDDPGVWCTGGRETRSGGTPTPRPDGLETKTREDRKCGPTP